MRIRHYCLIANVSILLILLSQTGFAKPTSHPKKPKQQFVHGIATFSAGAAFTPNLGESTSIPIINPAEDIYYYYNATSKSQTNALLGGFLGAEFLIVPTFSIQAGLGYYQPLSLNAKGILTQGADPGSTSSYNYHYNLTSQQLLVESKYLYNISSKYFYGSQQFHPYALLGLGVAWNKAYDFAADITPAFIESTYTFSNHTTASFSYSVGFGMDMDLLSFLRLGIGYRFSDLGKTQLTNGQVSSVATTYSITQNNLYSNEVLAQLTLVI